MNASTSSSSSPAACNPCPVAITFMLAKSAVWLLLGSILALIGSLKFHQPNILADCPWLTYGRIQPAQTNIFLYGFASQAGLAVALWLLCRLGRTTLARPGVVLLGAIFWNIGVLIGVVGILAGHSTGFEWLELSRHAWPILFSAYALIGVCALTTFHRREDRTLYVSQWFLVAALFVFPWVFTTANLLLVTVPVRGVMQAVIAGWYAGNFSQLWLGFIGLSVVFYLLPKLTRRPLHSYYLAMFAFWLLLLLGTWTGVPGGAPVPAWMPSLSAVATLLMAVPVLAVMINVKGTVCGHTAAAKGEPAFRFVFFAALAYVVAGLVSAATVVRPLSEVLDFTFFTVARTQLHLYGFVAMALFGAIYYLVPRLTGDEWPSARLVGFHFWASAIGILLIVVSLGAAGIAQGKALADPGLAFMESVKRSLMFFRMSTLGELLLLAGHAAFALNVGLLLAGRCGRVCRTVVAAAKSKPMEVLS